MTQPGRISTVPVAHNELTFGSLARRVQRINPNQGPLYVNGTFAECPVCLNEFEIATLFPCGHGVCDTCVTSMVTNDRVQCPLCKRTVPCGDLVHIHLEKGLRDSFKQFMASLERIKGLVADRVPMGVLPIHDPAAPKAHFGFASAPGVAATLIAVPPAAAACQQQKAVVFVIDESGSMRNDLDKAFRALQAALLAMIGGYAAVVVFNSKADLITPPHRVTEESITETMAALYATSATGATQLDLALDLAANGVAEEMRELIAQDGEQALPRVVVVTDGEASNQLLAAEVLGRITRTPIFIIGFGHNYSYNNCHGLFMYSTQSAANFTHAGSAEELKCVLLAEQRALSSVRVSYPAGSQIYCNGRVTPVGAEGVYETAFDPTQGIRFAVGSPTALDLGTLMIGGSAAAAVQQPELGLEASGFMGFMGAMQYVMDLGSQLHQADTHTLCSLLTRTRTTVCGFGACMAEVVRVIDELLARAAATDRGVGGDSNATARLASAAITRATSCA
jgi:hypothetical protein